MTRPTRGGFAWGERDRNRYQKPVWTTEPKLEGIEVVCRRVLKLRPGEDCTVELFSSGVYSKSFLIVIPSRRQRLILKASLPVDPYHKTIGEVAIIHWVRLHPKIPVPFIMDFDSSSDNEIGCEWLLVPFIAGKPADKGWHRMSMTAKQSFTKQVAEFEAQLLSASEIYPHMRGVGTLTSAKETPGQHVARHWFTGGHFEYNVPRGPFHSSREWLDSDIRISKLSIGSDYLRTQDICVTAIQYSLEVADKLLEALPTIFPATEKPEPTTISLQHLRLNNILVNKEGAITGVLDWEFAAAIPRWLAPEMPEFLRGPERLTKPMGDTYDDWEPVTAEEYRKGLFDHMTIDDDAVETWWWFDRMEYERTQLREVYTDCMRELRPTWDAEVAGSSLKREFFSAVKLLEANRCTHVVSMWNESRKHSYDFRLVDVWAAWIQGRLATMLPKMKWND